MEAIKTFLKILCVLACLTLLGFGCTTTATDFKTQHSTEEKLNTADADAHTNLGNELGRKGDLEGAITEYRAALRLAPNHVDAHTNLGVALKSLGRKAEAKGEFQQALKLLERVPGTQKKVEDVRQQLRDVE